MVPSGFIPDRKSIRVKMGILFGSNGLYRTKTYALSKPGHK